MNETTMKETAIKEAIPNLTNTTTKYNSPIEYRMSDFDYGFNFQGGELPEMIYASNGKEIVTQIRKPYNSTSVEEVISSFDELDFAMVEEIGRSKFLSSLQIYQFVSLRGLKVDRILIRKRLRKMLNLRVLKEYMLIVPGRTSGLRCYELDFKGVMIASGRGVVFHKGNRCLSVRTKLENGLHDDATDIKRILVGNMIILGLLLNKALLTRFGIQETIRPIQEAPIADGCILRTVANVRVTADTVLLYEVVRNAPDSLTKLSNKIQRYYMLINSDKFRKSNTLGCTSVPQLVVCGENLEHNLAIDRYLRSNGLFDKQNEILYTEDHFYLQRTLTNLYTIDDNGERMWFSIPQRPQYPAESRRCVGI
jgi:hypothetical protein